MIEKYVNKQIWDLVSIFINARQDMGNGVSNMVKPEEMQRLKALKTNKNFTNQDISNLTGIPNSTISNIFTGKTATPSYDNIRDIVIALDGSLDEIAGITKAPEEAKKEERELNDMVIGLYERDIRYKNIWIIMLAILLVLIVSVFVIMTLYDMSHPTSGWIINEDGVLQAFKDALQFWK